ncbi:MAG: hypothetical protein HY355_04800, partial [Armatimonadetes bacterium]|nr:hypothetical protein [Armatimonadota bacterium]
MHLLRWTLAAAVAAAVLAAIPARAADVTEVPEGVGTAAVAAFRAGLALHKEKQYAAAIKEYE